MAVKKVSQKKKDHHYMKIVIGSESLHILSYFMVSDVSGPPLTQSHMFDRSS